MLAHLLAAVVIAAPVRQDSVRISTALSDDHIVAGDAVRFEVTVETSGDSPRSITLDPLPAGFQIVGRETNTVLARPLTGGPRLVTTQSWLIVGRVPGSYTIPSANIVVNRRTHRTDPVPIAVLEAPTRDAPPDPVDMVRLNARVEPDRIYVGQQVTFIAEAEFPRSLRQRQSRPATYQAPNPSGFWAQDLPDPIVIGLRSMDGNLYDTQTFRRAYFPLLPGEQVIPPAKLAFEYRGSLGLVPESRELLSDTLHIEVLPVPDEGRPASFNGAVGRYDMRTAVDARQLRVGDATTLVVEVSGKGNVKALPAPELPDREGLEVFPPTESAEVETSSTELGGTKRFEWVVVPAEPGRLVIAPIEYAAFDPIAERFDIMRSDSIVLDVTGQSAASPAGVDLRPIRGRPSDGTPAWLLSPAFAAAQLVPLLVLLAAWLSVRDSSAPGRKRLAENRARRFQDLRRDALAPDAGFWGRLADAIRASIAETIDRPSLRPSPVDTLHDAMIGQGVPRATAAALADVLRGLDRIRYAPGAIAPADAPGSVDRAHQLVEAMAASIARTSRHNTAMPARIALLLLAPSPLASQVPAFERGVHAYREADYPAAAVAFLEHVATHPSDADGWYDAGNALFRSGDTGRAVAAWVRALRIRPRHADARANLHAVSPSAAAHVPPIASLTVPQTVLILTGAWWIASLLIAIRIRGRRPVGRIVAAAVAVVILTAIGGFAGFGQRPTAISLGQAVVRVDPVLKGEAIERLPAGAPVEVVDRRAGWLLVRTDPGREGWVDASLVEEV